MNDKSLLVVDDDKEIRNLLQEYLIKNSFNVYVASDAVEMDEILSQVDIDLLTLDLMLPGEDGFEICKRLRSTLDIPIIMLTACSEDTDRIVGLEIGADDYLPKPFNPRELLARIKAIFRRMSSNDIELGKDEKIKKYYFNDWELDVTNRQLISHDKIVVSLSGAEFKLLNILVEHANRVLSRDQLMDWTVGRESTPFDRSIDVQVSRLRHRLNDSGKTPKLIKTIRGEGYVFTASVKKEVR